MRFRAKLLLILAILMGVGVASFQPVQQYWIERNRPHFREAHISRGRIVAVVNSTGTVQPVLRVQVGSFVSGPIIELNVDFNDEVKKGDVLAKIDPRLYEANVERDKAALATREAEVERVEAQLQHARNDEKRAIALRGDNADFISDSEMDGYVFHRCSLEAELDVAKAQVAQARGNLNNSQANLEYTRIVSPVDGIIIDRKIDPGQTLAAQFQTPELFVVAPDMRKEMHIFASVDEADIGLIRGSKERGEPVRFTVDAYPEDVFVATILQIRMSSTTTQNVVTYPVVVSAPNPDLKLLPGMTANISFQLQEKNDLLRIPNAALRFYPQREHVRAEDRKLLDGSGTPEEDEEDTAVPNLDATEEIRARKKRNHRHVWIIDEGLLKAAEVVTGISNNRYSELVSGDLHEGQTVVTGVESAESRLDVKL